MICPACKAPTRVLESRPAEGGSAVRRRRACGRCGSRFTTFERVQAEPLTVRKRDGSRQRFNREKLRASLLAATHKRRVSRAQVDALVARIEAAAASGGGEVAAERLGQLCLEGLRELDHGAYLQFAGTLPEPIPELAAAEAFRPGRAQGSAVHPESPTQERIR